TPSTRGRYENGESGDQPCPGESDRSSSFLPCRFLRTPFVVLREQSFKPGRQYTRGDTTMRSTSRASALAIAAVIPAPSPMQAQAPGARTAQGAWGGKTNGLGHYADVNGIKLYYESHGAGRPLILLHGGLGAIEMFGPNLPALAERHRVVAVDLQGHGRTADVDRPISVETMAEDIAALIKKLGLEKPDVMG